MRLLASEREEVAGVASRWKAQYCDGRGLWHNHGGSNRLSTYEQLRHLSPEATAAEVAAIIGNDTWVGETCTECHSRKAIALVGEEPDYESATVYLCAECICKLYTMATARDDQR